MPTQRRRSTRKTAGTRQRSFRFRDTTLSRLERRAGELGESQNSLAERMIEEGLRIEAHPLVYFRRGTAGRRPAIVGTRLDLWQLIEALRANEGNVEEAAGALGVPETYVRAAVRYYAEFKEEVDAWAEREREVAQREEEAWRRAQEVLA